jgi:hypothetical protein
MLTDDHRNNEILRRLRILTAIVPLYTPGCRPECVERETAAAVRARRAHFGAGEWSSPSSLRTQA